MGSWKNSFDRASYQTVLIVKTLSNQNYWFIFLRKEKEISFISIDANTFEIKTNIKTFCLYGYNLLIPFKSPTKVMERNDIKYWCYFV